MSLPADRAFRRLVVLACVVALAGMAVGAWDGCVSGRLWPAFAHVALLALATLPVRPVAGREPIALLCLGFLVSQTGFYALAAVAVAVGEPAGVRPPGGLLEGAAWALPRVALLAAICGAFVALPIVRSLRRSGPLCALQVLGAVLAGILIAEG